MPIAILTKGAYQFPHDEDTNEYLRIVLGVVDLRLSLDFGDSPKLIDAIRATINHFLEMEAEFLGAGRTRIVFALDEDRIVKIPFSNEGLSASGNEAMQCEAYSKTGEGIPVADCEFVLFAGVGIEVLVMERLRSFPARADELPGWADFVDCRQVGYNSKGELVAFDL